MLLWLWGLRMLLLHLGALVFGRRLVVLLLALGISRLFDFPGELAEKDLLRLRIFQNNLESSLDAGVGLHELSSHLRVGYHKANELHEGWVRGERRSARIFLQDGK